MKNIDIQFEVQKIHSQYGTTEMANYQIQKLFDKALANAIQALLQSEAESTIKEIERRLLIIKSEPNGIVRETMLDDLLINLTPPQTK